MSRHPPITRTEGQDVPDSYRETNHRGRYSQMDSRAPLAFLYEEDGPRLSRPPRFPNFQSKQIRVQTFHRWLKSQSPEDMAEAGLYSTNDADAVRCFHCGIGLSGWESEDDPWVEHARWSQSCEYVIAMKGQDFVDLVQEAVENQQEPVIPQLEDTHLPDIEMDAGSVTADPIAMGGRPTIPVANTHHEQSKVNTQHPRIGRNEYPEATLKKNPLLTDAAQSVLEMGYLPKAVKRAIDNVLIHTDWKNLSAQMIMEEILSLEELGEHTQTSRRSHRIVTPSEAELPVARSKLQEENQFYKDMTTCKICTENPVGIVFLPCGHLVCCPQCAPALRNCPMCRNQVKGTVRVSFS